MAVCRCRARCRGRRSRAPRGARAGRRAKRRWAGVRRGPSRRIRPACWAAVRLSRGASGSRSSEPGARWAHERDRHRPRPGRLGAAPVGAPDRRHRGRAPHRRAGPDARHAAVEGRRPRRGRPAPPHPLVGAVAGRAAAPPRARRGLPPDDEAARRGARRALAVAGPRRHRRVGVRGGVEALTAAETYAVFDEAVGRNTAGSTRRSPRAGSTSSPTSTTATATTRGCGACCATCSRSTPATHGHADLLREAVDGRVGEDPPAGLGAAWR